MRKIDRFDKYMNLRGLNDNKVTVQLGLTIGIIGKSRKEGRDLSDNSIEQILNFYTDINRVWLLTGEGEMLRTEQKTENFSENNSGVSNVTGNGNRIKNEVTTPVAADISVEMLLKEMAEQRKAYIAQLEAKDRFIEKLMDK